MTIVHGIVGLPVPEAPNALADFAVGRPVTVATLGPAGTSADCVARALKETLSGQIDVELSLREDITAVRNEVLEGRAELALIPSAHREATDFHWHPELRLRGAFVHSTPPYGIAIRPGFSPASSITLASMPEVRRLFDQLAPGHLIGAVADELVTTSTSSAAAMVGTGQADMAVCNDEARRLQDLTWFRVRNGVPIVWMLFGNDDEGESGSTRIHREER
ncbi:hypothetical protein [Curtobacterium flaccumfaciens]|uniref:hypothetical protein n=1 Tax=Curtobacterium flaccumfaciens TaxID=2035 RepID=UPI001BDF2A4B|nr:hypothetical protein [Curtobacterium flaccumfaciens]MBT1672294.1 hypothetical protein [Curtobacterium flaccumfaciens pv. flaccumfaciens]